MVMASGLVFFEMFFGLTFLIVTINLQTACHRFSQNQRSSLGLETSKVVSSAFLVGGH